MHLARLTSETVPKGQVTYWREVLWHVLALTGMWNDRDEVFHVHLWSRQVASNDK